MELAILLPFLVMVIVGAIEFGFAFDTQQELQHAARVGVREYVLDADVADAEAATLASTRLDAALLSISTTPCVPGTPASLTVEFPFDLSIPFVGNDSLTLSATATMQCTGSGVAP